MSTSNIIGIASIEGGGCAVTFRVHGKDGQRTYYYDKSDAIEIMAGADPAGFSGSNEPPDPIGNVIGMAIEIALRATEIL